MCSRNKVRESSHISFFCGEDPFCEVMQRPQNTHGELTGGLEWPAGLSPSLERPVDLCLLTKITDLILSLKSHAEIWTSSPHVFCCLWLVIGTYTLLGFFPVIHWSYLRTEISVILSIGKKYILAIILYFSLSCETTLLMLSCDCIESAKFIFSS